MPRVQLCRICRREVDEWEDYIVLRGIKTHASCFRNRR
jgi:hypothetical protein